MLWSAIYAITQNIPDVDVLVYAASEDVKTLESSGKDMGTIINAQMNLPMKKSITVGITKLNWYKWAEAERYPRFTLLLQTLGGLVLGFEALWKQNVDLFIDTAGHPFAIAVAKAFGITTLSYVHYPVISTDMLSVVRDRKSQFNNSERIARSRFLSHAKLAYYNIFACLYGLAGRRNDFTIVNSTWTRNHIESIWGFKNKLCTVFPPCDVKRLIQMPADVSSRDKHLIISIGQYRPEKNHLLQLQAFKLLLNKDDPDVRQARLVMIGGTRHREDHQRAISLIETAKELGIHENVEVHINASRPTLIDRLRTASIGIHTMRAEHFGISVVELMAAGLITIAHDSGGVREDIIENGKNGYLASSAEEYAHHMYNALTLKDENVRTEMQAAARETAQSFSQQRFTTEVLAITDRAIDLAISRGHIPDKIIRQGWKSRLDITESS